MNTRDHRLSLQHGAPWPRRRKVVSVVVIVAILGGLLGVAVLAVRRVEMNEARKLEWRAVKSAWGGVQDWEFAESKDRPHGLSSTDIDALVAVIRDARSTMVMGPFVWLVNVSPEDWSDSFAGHQRVLIAVADRSSGEIAFLSDGFSIVNVRGSSLIVDYSHPFDANISPEGARRLTKGWVRIEP